MISSWTPVQFEQVLDLLDIDNLVPDRWTYDKVFHWSMLKNAPRIETIITSDEADNYDHLAILACVQIKLLSLGLTPPESLEIDYFQSALIALCVLHNVKPIDLTD